MRNHYLAVNYKILIIMNEYVVLTKAIHTKIRSVWVLQIVTSMEQACCRTFFTDRLLLLLFCPGKAKVTPENICRKKKENEDRFKHTLNETIS